MSRPVCLPRSIAVSAALVLLASVCLRARAQEPVDNDLWKQRCLQLGAQSDAIDRGSAPPELLQMAHGVAGAKFAAVGQERAHAGQHYIACTMYYTAAMAEHLGNGGKVDTSKAHTDIVLGGAEAKQAAGLPLSFKEKMDRTSGKLNPVGKGGLTPQDVAMVYAAFGEGGGQAGGFPSPAASPPRPGPGFSALGQPAARQPLRQGAGFHPLGIPAASAAKASGHPKAMGGHRALTPLWELAAADRVS